MQQQYLAVGLVALAVIFLVREVIGWIRRGGKSASCPGCGHCGKPTKINKKRIKSEKSS